MPETLEDAALPIEPIEPAAVRADPNTPATVFEDGPDARVAERCGIVGVVREVGGFARVSREASQAVVAADPERAGRVCVQHVDLVGGFGGAVETEVRCAASLRIEVVEPCAACPGPDRAVRVQNQAPDDVAADAVAVRGIVAVRMDALRSAFHARETAAVRRYPKIAVGVLGDVVDIVAAKRLGVAALVAVVAKLITVVAVEAVLGAEPHVPGRVLPDREDVALRQPVLDRDATEAHRMMVLCGGAVRRHEHWSAGQRGPGHEHAAEAA